MEDARHPQLVYRALDGVATTSCVASQRTIDGRNVLDPAIWRAGGWEYRGLGWP